MKTNYNIYFITSNKSRLNRYLSYYLEKTNLSKNLKEVYSYQIEYRHENFTVYVYSINISVINPNKNEKEIKTKKHILSLKLKRLDYLSEHIGIIYYEKNQNNFIYNFNFGHSSFYSAPNSISFSPLEQLKLYEKVINQFNIINNETLLLDLLIDSKNYLIDNNKFYFDFYLEVFKLCYNKKEVKDLLIIFNLNSVILPDNFNKADYSVILYKIEKDKSIITKYCEKDENHDRYHKIFYTILLYYSKNYENEMIFSFLINRKDLWKYYIDILPINYKYFCDINTPNELIDEIFTKNSLSYEIIKGTLYYLKSIEIMLSFINKYSELIFQCLTKENKKIEISDYLNKNNSSNIQLLLNELEKLINTEIKNNQLIIIFNEKFWKNYIIYLEDNLKKLILIKKGILLCQKIDKNLNFNYNNIIHEAVLNIIKNGKLKNENLLDYIEKDDIYFKEDKYKSKKYRPLVVIEKGIDLNYVNNEFFEKWNNIGVLNIYSFDENSVLKIIIDKIKYMKDFWKLLKLFNIKELENNKSCSINLIKLISDKYNSLLKTYDKNECQNIIKESSLIIYLLDYNNLNVQDQLKKNIEKRLPCSLVNDIYLYFSLNYKDISKDMIEIISNYLISEYNLSKVNNILYILKQLKSENIFKSFFNKLNKFIIKEEEIFEETKEIDSFIFLKEIQKEGLFEKYKSLKETKYYIDTINSGKNIINNIKEGNIKYKYFNSWKKPEGKELIKEKLSILFFKDDKIINNNMDKCNYYIEKIMQILLNIKKLSEILKNCYEISYQKNIGIINELEYKIKNGMLNEIENKETKEIIEKIYQILPDLDKKYELIHSIIFIKLFNSRKKNNSFINEEDNFRKTENDFEKLKLLFNGNENWTIKIDESIIEEIIELIKKKINEDKLIEELIFIKNYFKFNEINESYIKKVSNEFTIYIKKKELYKIINDNISFLSDIQNKNDEPSIFFNTFKIDLLNIKNILNRKEEEMNKELEEEINLKSNIIIQLKKELDSKTIEIKNLELRMKELLIKSNDVKEKENNVNKRLKNELNLKNKEIKELNIKISRFPFELSEKEKMISIIILTSDQNVVTSFICKNTDKFDSIEKKFYELYPEYQQKNTKFINKKNLINNDKTLEENKINNNDIIILKTL